MSRTSAVRGDRANGESHGLVLGGVELGDTALEFAAALGYAVADVSSEVTGSGMAALAAGGLLAMLTNSLISFAYERGGELAGVATVVGFCVSVVGT